MTLKLEEVTDEKDFDQIIVVLYNSFSEPYNSLLKWFVPVHTTLEEALEGSKGRNMRSWKQNPENHWLKVTDTKNGKLIGAACWEIKEKFMKSRMIRPHMELEQIIVLPEHRRRGAGKMLIEWGVKKADDLGLESCVQSVPFAVPAYEACGYARLDCNIPDMSLTDPSEKWQEWQRDDMRTFMMWRPAGHDYRVGVDKAPWMQI